MICCTQESAPTAAGKVIAGLVESNGSLPPGGWLVGWLPVHRDQLGAQRSVTSMGSLYLYLWDLHLHLTCLSWTLDQQQSASKRHLDRFSCFYTADERHQHRSVTLLHVQCCRLLLLANAVMQPNNSSIYKIHNVSNCMSELIFLLNEMTIL